MRKVLVPMDGSRSAMRALTYALSRADREALSVQLIYVHFIPPFYENAEAYLQRAQNRQLAEKHAASALDPAIEKMAQAGIEHRTMVNFGDAAPEIVRAATRLNCESIIMGSRGMGAIRGLVLGSTSMKVVCLATIPVTIVK